MGTYILKISGIMLMFAYFINTTYAKCENYPIKVQNGTECSGFLLSEPQFLEASNNKKQVRVQKLKLAVFEGMEEIYDMRHKSYVDELKSTRNELKWLEVKSNIGYVISFSLGAVITGIIAKEVAK